MSEKPGKIGHFRAFLGPLLANCLQENSYFANGNGTKFYEYQIAMGRIYIYLDKRAPKKDGSCPLKVAFCHKHNTAYSPLDVSLKPEEWDEEKQSVVGRADKKFQNILIRKRMAEMTLALNRIMLRDDYDDLTAKDIMHMFVRGADTVDKPEDLDYLVPVYNEYITLCRKPSTAASYRSSLRNLTEFCKDIDTLRFKDVNVAWLRRYQKWLLEDRGMEVNGANVYMRNLRTVFNYAIHNDFTKARYPFRDVDMSTTVPYRHDVTWDMFLEWVSKPMGDNREFYRDLFMLSFYLCGIRPVDLLYVKKDQVENGRLVYWPQKLNGRTRMSIKIEPEAWEIIHKYEGTEHLLNVMDERDDYKAFMQHWNKALKAIGTDIYTPTKCGNGKVYQLIKHDCLIPFITIYYARYCWGSFAYNLLDTPIDIISQAYGHKSGLKVTNFYVKRSVDKVDQVNRALIDRLKKDLAEFHKL